MASDTPSIPPTTGDDRWSTWAVRSAARLSPVLLDAARYCGARLGADQAGVFEPVNGGEVFRAEVAPTMLEPGEEPPAPQLVPAADSMAAYALATANVVVSPDLRQDARFDDLFLRDQAVRAALMLPLWVADRPVCLLGVFRSRPREFTLDEVWYVERLADPLTRLVEVAGCQLDRNPTADATPENERLLALDDLAGQVQAAAANEERLAAELGGSPVDSRVSPRHDYPYRQQIAPIYDGQMPGWDDFVEVRCGDLSKGGISLWLSNKPDFREMVVALGRPPSLAHFTARVVHTRTAQRGGRIMYQVGCQFLRRVYL